MKGFAIFAVALVAVNAVTVEKEWTDFKVIHFFII